MTGNRLFYAIVIVGAAMVPEAIVACGGPAAPDGPTAVDTASATNDTASATSDAATVKKTDAGATERDASPDAHPTDYDASDAWPTTK